MAINFGPLAAGLSAGLGSWQQVQQRKSEEERQREQDALQQELIRLQMQRQQQDLEWNEPGARAQRATAERARERFNAMTDHERAMERAAAVAEAQAAARQPTDPNLTRQRAQTVQQNEAKTAVQSILRPGQAEYIAFTSPNPENAVNLMVQNARRVAPNIPEHVLRAEVNRVIEEVRSRGRGQGGDAPLLTPEMIAEAFANPQQ